MDNVRLRWCYPVAGLLGSLMVAVIWTVGGPLFPLLPGNWIAGLSALAVFLPAAVATGCREGKLLAMAARDPLTGLWNQGAFQAHLEEQLSHCRRRASPLAILLIDVDELKGINDRYGHLAGDAALRWVGEALRSSCRAGDVVARQGGDEFAVLAPDTSRSEAQMLAERIRRAVASRPVTDGRLAVSVSVGVAEAGSSSTVREVLEAADRRLYAAKASGRNRVVCDSATFSTFVRGMQA